MKRELVESAGLEIYAEIGVVIFVVVFLLIIVRVFFMNKKEADEIGEIPLEDDISPSEILTSDASGHTKEA